MNTSIDLGGLGELSVYPDETARALFRRKAGRPFDVGIPLLADSQKPGRSAPGLFPGDIVEVHGESGSGKTEVGKVVLGPKDIRSVASVALGPTLAKA